MSTNENRPAMGSRLFPGVDLTLWLNLVLMALLIAGLIGGGVAAVLH
jgi:hypothetical protein